MVGATIFTIIVIVLGEVILDEKSENSMAESLLCGIIVVLVACVWVAAILNLFNQHNIQ